MGLNLSASYDNDAAPEELPKISFARENLLEEVKRALGTEGNDRKKGVSLVVIGTSKL